MLYEIVKSSIWRFEVWMDGSHELLRSGDLISERIPAGPGVAIILYYIALTT